MKKHLKYLRYLLRHKFYVFVAGFDTGAPLWRLIIHDWSKFLPSEWFPYAKSFYGPQPRPIETKQAFDRAWLLHQRRNKHHWQFWVLKEDSGGSKAVRIPEKYVREMVADWMGAGYAITGRWEVLKWYAMNERTIVLHEESRALVDKILKSVTLAERHTKVMIPGIRWID